MTITPDLMMMYDQRSSVHDSDTVTLRQVLCAQMGVPVFVYAPYIRSLWRPSQHACMVRVHVLCGPACSRGPEQHPCAGGFGSTVCVAGDPVSARIGQRPSDTACSAVVMRAAGSHPKPAALAQNIMLKIPADSGNR